MRFRDRQDAGRMLASAMSDLRDSSQTIVLGLPRGGVPVAFEVASALKLPLDLLVVRKLGLPSQPELAMGAIGPGGVCILNDEVLENSFVTRDEISEVIAREEKELARREELYRAGKPPINLIDQRVILVDDGLATGTTMRAAIAVVRKLGAAEIIVAVPVSADETARQLEDDGLKVVCLLRPLGMEAIGLWYSNFDQLRDSEVLEFLRRDTTSQGAVGAG